MQINFRANERETVALALVALVAHNTRLSKTDAQDKLLHVNAAIFNGARKVVIRQNGARLAIIARKVVNGARHETEAVFTQ